ncbi:MAG: GtrA family protein [Propionibacteriaceae bacterium]|jgi:putative flippase GtrA|nr:GtrA family protein [Propionibacteriaceae bacterium]
MSESVNTNAESKRGGWASFVRYLAVGVFNSLLDLGLFSLLAAVIGLHPILANTISTTITMCVSFLLNSRWVFRSRQQGIVSFVVFVAITLTSGLVVQGAVIWTIVHLVPPMIPTLSFEIVAIGAKICAMGVGMVCNFLGYRWLFSWKSKKGDQ